MHKAKCDTFHLSAEKYKFIAQRSFSFRIILLLFVVLLSGCGVKGISHRAVTVDDYCPGALAPLIAHDSFKTKGKWSLISPENRSSGSFFLQRELRYAQVSGKGPLGVGSRAFLVFIDSRMEHDPIYEIDDYRLIGIFNSRDIMIPNYASIDGWLRGATSTDLEKRGWTVNIATRQLTGAFGLPVPRKMIMTNEEQESTLTLIFREWQSCASPDYYYLENLEQLAPNAR